MGLCEDVLPLALQLLSLCSETAAKATGAQEGGGGGEKGGFPRVVRELASKTEEIEEVVRKAVETCVSTSQRVLLVQDVLVQCLVRIQAHVLDVVGSAHTLGRNPCSYVASQRLNNSLEDSTAAIGDLQLAVDLFQSATEGGTDGERWTPLLNGACDLAKSLQDLVDVTNTIALRNEGITSAKPKYTAAQAKLNVMTDSFIALVRSGSDATAGTAVRQRMLLGELYEAVNAVSLFASQLLQSRGREQEDALNALQEANAELSLCLQKIILFIVNISTWKALPEDEVVAMPEGQTADEEEERGPVAVAGTSTALPAVPPRKMRPYNPRLSTANIMHATRQRLEARESKSTTSLIVAHMRSSYPWFARAWAAEDPRQQQRCLQMVEKMVVEHQRQLQLSKQRPVLAPRQGVVRRQVSPNMARMDKAVTPAVRKAPGIAAVRRVPAPPVRAMARPPPSHAAPLPPASNVGRGGGGGGGGGGPNAAKALMARDKRGLYRGQSIMGSLAGSAGQQKRITQASLALRSMSKAQSRTQVGEVMLIRKSHMKRDPTPLGDAKRLSLSQDTLTRTICAFQVAVEHIIRTFVPKGTADKIDVSVLHENIQQAFASLTDMLILIGMQRNEQAREPPPKAEQTVSQDVFELLSSRPTEEEEGDRDTVKATDRDGPSLVLGTITQSLGRVRDDLWITALHVTSYATVIRATKDNSQTSLMLFLATLQLFVEETVKVVRLVKTFNLVLHKMHEMLGTFKSVNKEIDPFWEEIGPRKKLEKPKNMTAATINELIFHLTNPKKVDKEFSEVFLTTFPSIMAPGDLVRKLQQRFDVPTEFKSHQEAIQKRVLQVISEWMNEGMSSEEELKLMLTNASQLYPRYKKYLQPLVQRLMDVQQAESQKVVLMPFDSTTLQPMTFKSSLEFLSLDSTTIARQLTLIDWSLFVEIQPSELLGLSWNNPKTKHRATRTLELINRQNKLTMWVATMIVIQPTVKKRVEMWEKYISIAKVLRKMNNYNTLMGIVAGINVSATQRLKHTKGHVKKALASSFQALDKLMNPNRSWREFRAALESSHLPALPYLGVFLTDLTFTEDGNKDFIEGNKVNWKKRQLLYKILSSLRRFQGVPYAIPIENPAYTLLRRLPALGDEALYELSLLREPRGEEYKALLRRENETATG